MGAKTWMLAYSDGNPSEVLRSKPQLDRDATRALASALFPGERLLPLEDGDLSVACPPDGEIVIGCFPGLAIVAAREFGLDRPSGLPPVFLSKAPHKVIHLHAMHSVVDWLAFAVWRNGELRRSLSLSPDSGVIEEIGPRLAFEEPYWTGMHPALDPEEDPSDYPFVFHPLELGEAALDAFFGYQIEGLCGPDAVEPEGVTLLRYRRSRPWWRVW